MRKSLLVALAVLAAGAVGFNVGLRAAGPIKVECGGPKQGVSLKDAGALDDDGSCDLSWAYCWRRT